MNIASAFDIIAKIACELNKYSGYDFSRYPKMQSSNVLYNKNLIVSPILKQPGMLFSEPDIVHKIEMLRREYVHNGPWDRRPNIYYPYDNINNPLPPYMMMPDMTEDGNFLNVKNRRKFYNQERKLNIELIPLVQKALDIINNTIAGLRKVAQLQTETDGADETVSTIEALEQVYKEIGNLHCKK